MSPTPRYFLESSAGLALFYKLQILVHEYPLFGAPRLFKVDYENYALLPCATLTHWRAQFIYNWYV
jgi:hypothetical protein